MYVNKPEQKLPQRPGGLGRFAVRDHHADGLPADNRVFPPGTASFVLHGHVESFLRVNTTTRTNVDSDEFFEDCGPWTRGRHLEGKIDALLLNIPLGVFLQTIVGTTGRELQVLDNLL